ncbi:hypothetical protein BZL29_7048 [Mycobacterium kansasii]|uniref:Uncharacterized protein n=1 Tax=Mycobacterium kansasii TaxID=1768 RepID=A0A1V3WJM6_MYCKA|nr:hypothetical protein BZL29_7048 [Mycobacterium kansasii]
MIGPPHRTPVRRSPLRIRLEFTRQSVPVHSGTSHPMQSTSWQVGRGVGRFASPRATVMSTKKRRVRR